jgi:hypothetical protein
VRHALFAVTASVMLLGQGAPLNAGMPVPVEITCPVGGKKFTFIDTMSSSRWGSRPDGKPYGSWTFPMPVPACPDNGLVMYRQFTEAEIKQLKGLLKTPDFQKVRNETTYYRIAWFMRALHDKDEATVLWMINQASWQADGDPEIKARYQREFAEGMAALPKEPDSLDWIALQGRAANAWRELGDFERAKQVIASVSTNNLDVPIPAEVVSGTTPSGLGKAISNYGEIMAAKSKRGWLSYFTDLKKLIERQDSSPEPIDMIPIREAASKCMDMKQAGGQLDPYCSSDAVMQQMDAFQKMQEAIGAERSKQH